MSKSYAGLAFAGLLTFLLAAACGGGGDDDAGGNEITLDPARAAELAHAALLTATDLPGTGWELTGEDSFSDDDEPPFDTAACREITTKINEAGDRAEAARAGRAQRALSRLGPSDILGTEVDLSVNVFEDVETPQQSMRTFREVLASDAFEECFLEGLRAAVEAEGATVEAEATKPLANAPFGGEAIAYTFHIEAAGESLDMVMEFYLWRWGNAGISLGVSGENLEAAFVREVVAKADEKIRAAAE